MCVLQPEANIIELQGSFNLQILPGKAFRSQTYAYEIHPSQISALTTNRFE